MQCDVKWNKLSSNGTACTWYHSHGFCLLPGLTPHIHTMSPHQHCTGIRIRLQSINHALLGERGGVGDIKNWGGGASGQAGRQAQCGSR